MSILKDMKDDSDILEEFLCECGDYEHILVFSGWDYTDPDGRMIFVSLESGYNNSMWYRIKRWWRWVTHGNRPIFSEMQLREEDIERFKKFANSL